MEVKGEQGGAEGGPQQAEEQKHTLIAPSLVSVEVEEPELGVHHHEECTIQSGVENCEAKMDRWGKCRLQGNWGRLGGGVRMRCCDWSFHWVLNTTNSPSSEKPPSFPPQLEPLTWGF